MYAALRVEAGRAGGGAPTDLCRFIAPDAETVH